MPFISNLAEDLSYKVRQGVVDQLMVLSNSIGSDNSEQYLTTYFCQFLEDSASEVRTSACKRLGDFGSKLD